MSDAPQPSPPASNGSPTPTPPPFIHVIKLATGCQVTSNLSDPWIGIALLEMGKHALLEGMKPTLIAPHASIGGLLKRMTR